MARTFYDQVAFPGRPYLQTHPDRLALVARLFGMNPQATDRCHVLEVGCGDGANLLGMAVALPHSEFCGIDLAEEPLKRGRTLATQAGIRNVSLRAMDFRDADSSLGKFDYVISHGVYSWIPPEARDRLLEVCNERLRPNGVAMVSYAVYPGAYVTQMLREPMLFHSARPLDPVERVAQARDLMNLLADYAPAENGLRELLRHERDLLSRREDGEVFHDELSGEYAPIYFFQFIRHTSEHGLQYVGEASVGEMGENGIDPKAVETVGGGDRLALEQYFDFLRFRRFRQSVVCHAELKLADAPDPDVLRECYYGAFLVSAGPEALKNVTTRGTITTSDLGTRAFLEGLSRMWPRFVHFRDLENPLPPDVLFQLFAGGVIDIRTVGPLMDAEGDPRPQTSALARVQAASGKSVTSLLHHRVTLEDDSVRAFLAALDGTRTRAELIDELALRNPSATRELVAREVQEHLDIFRRHALLKMRP